MNSIEFLCLRPRHDLLAAKYHASTGLVSGNFKRKER